MQNHKVWQEIWICINEKWQPIYDGKYENDGCRDCYLCRQYYAKRNCASCPITKDTGKPYCIDTPYDLFYNLDRKLQNAWFRDASNWGDLMLETKLAAQMEIDYLKQLAIKVKNNDL